MPFAKRRNARVLSVNLLISIIYALTLTACGGGGGGSGPTAPQTTVSTLTFNPSAALEPLYTTNRSIVNGTDRVQYSIGSPEVINGNTYQVENILIVAADNTSTTHKTYYTNSPLTLFKPAYYYVVGLGQGSNIVERLTQPFPTQAQVGSFGLFETATIHTRCYTDSFGNMTTQLCDRSTQSETSSWQLNADTATTAIFCFGTTNGSQNVAAQQCFKINSQNQVI